MQSTTSPTDRTTDRQFAPSEVARPKGETHVLVGYDGSANARYALRRTGEMFPGAPVIVASVWESLLSFEIRHGGFAPGYIPGESGTDLSQEASYARATAVAGRDIARSAGMEAEAISRQGSGPVWETLTQIADTAQPMVIVVGSRGLTGVRSMLLGSVSRHLVEGTHHPVLVIPPEEPALRGADGSGLDDHLKGVGEPSLVVHADHRGVTSTFDPATSETAGLADRLVGAWQSFDIEAFVDVFNPEGTLEVHGQATAVGTASIRQEVTAYFGEPLKMELTRRATTLHPDTATLTLGITLSRPNGTSVGPLAATVRLRRDGPRLSYVEISDFGGAGVPD